MAYTVIENKDFTHVALGEEEFEQTAFRNCIFSSLKGVAFSDCLFTSCNLSNAAVARSKMQQVTFSGCKLIGINFYEVRDFGFSVHFENCLLDYASFDNKKMNASSFSHCKIHGVNFSGADLSKATLENCDLTNTLFSATNLSGLDFTTNYNFTIDPVTNTVKKAKFLASDLSGLLAGFDIIIQ